MGRAVAIAGAGAWVLALAFGLGSAAWPEYVKPHPYAVVLLFAIGLLMLLVPAVQRFVPIFKDAPKPFQADVAINGIVRARSGGPQGRWQYGDIFVQASAHLKSPQSIKVEYVAELIRHGIPTRARTIDDVSAWRIAERNDHSVGRKGDYRNVLPVPACLSWKEKVDGWLHFQVDSGDEEITNSQLRLTVRSSDGAVVTERQLTGSFPSPLVIQRKLT